MRLLLAPDKFKGSLSALEAARALARGFQSVWPDAICDFAPIADGGEGFAAALAESLDAEWITLPSVDAIGRPIEARYAWVAAEKLAIMEMSEASGLWRLQLNERNPLRANTEGTGHLLRDAMERGARKIIIGLGGSATTDGGTALASVLGYRFLSQDGAPLSMLPRDLIHLARIERPVGLNLPEIVAACDVQNPLLGERGTVQVYGPQKGVDATTAGPLEQGLARLAEVVQADLGSDFRQLVGSGAAGGLGFGLLSFCGANIQSGFDVVAEVLRLDERIRTADWVVTGEGRIDDQTLDGKGPAGLALRARALGKRVVAFAGSVTHAGSSQTFDQLVPISDGTMSLEDSMRDAAIHLERAAARVAREWSGAT